MTHFLDGPAAGVSLNIRRSPKLLRVAHSPLRASWDALDQLDDTPRADETLTVYRLKGEAASVHFRGTRRMADGRCRTGGWTEQYAEYEVVAEQPEQAVLRDTAAWREWAAARAAKGEA